VTPTNGVLDGIVASVAPDLVACTAASEEFPIVT
jgi:hypothetical protein